MSELLTLEWKNEANEEVIRTCGDCEIACSSSEQANAAVRYFGALGLVATRIGGYKVKVSI